MSARIGNWIHLRCQLETWDFWIRINLCGSILGSAISSHSPTQPFSSATMYVAPTVGLSNLPVQIPRHQHGISGISMFILSEGCELWCTWFVLHCECFIYILIYDTIFMSWRWRGGAFSSPKLSKLWRFLIEEWPETQEMMISHNINIYKLLCHIQNTHNLKNWKDNTFSP